MSQSVYRTRDRSALTACNPLLLNYLHVVHPITAILCCECVRPFCKDFSASSTIAAGVSKSGSPTPRWIISAPLRSRALARSVISQARDRDPANPLVRLENGGIVKPLLIGLQGVKNEFQRTAEYTYWLSRFHILCSWPVPLSKLDSTLPSD